MDRIIEENANIDVGGNIYMNESLTPENMRLLKKAKIISRKIEYEFIGYTVNGQVRIWKNNQSEVTTIGYMADLNKIV